VGHKIGLTVIALAIAWAYGYLLVAAVGYAASLAAPSHWLILFPARHSGVLTWMVIWHTLAVLIISVPFGLLIQQIYGRRGLALALFTSLAMFALEMPYLGHLFQGQPLRLQMVAAFDQLKLIAVLPLAVWVFSKLAASNHLERT
jgi:hypothetical protein